MKQFLIYANFFCFLINNTILSKSPTPPLEKITEFRQQHRKTLDGRLCAAAFLHDNQTYTDCTDAVSPDGTSGREWCYVEVQLLGKGNRDWDYCANAINYDKLRIRAKRVFEEKSLNADRLKDRLNALNNKVYNMLQKYDSVCGKKHELINTRIEKIFAWLTTSEESLGKIEEYSNNINSTKDTIDRLQIDIKNETSSAKHAAENCENSPGYENEPVSDGLRVSYFTNPLFQGIPIATTYVKNPTFFYNNRGPVDNISPFKYGIRYEGYLLAPHNGTYIFTVETDCAVRLFLNNKPILIYGLEEVEENDKNYPRSTVRYSLRNDEKSAIVKKKSKPIELVGGEKNLLVLEVSHSSHLKYKNEESAHFKLLWKSSRINEQVIKDEYFFSENIVPPSRLTSLNSEFFEIGLLGVNEQVFKNSNNNTSNEWVFSIVPTKYIGLHLIRTEQNPHFNEFSLAVNTGSNLFIAFPSIEVLPLGPSKDSLWKVFDTADIFEIKNKKSGKKQQWKVKFIPLKHRSTLYFQVINTNVPFVLFNQQRKILPTICSGVEEVLSTPGNKVFKECIESSALTDEFNCIAGLNNLHLDKKYNIWRTANGAIGEYIHLFFNRPVQVNKFRFKPRDDVLTWPSEISLIFDDTEILVPILHTSNSFHNTFVLEHPVITTSVKVEIKDMFVHNDETGGSFEFLGNVCDITDVNNSTQHATIDIIECGTTLNSIPDVLPLVSGDKFLANCDLYCLENTTGDVFGSDIYAAESSLCKAAIHSGVCKAKTNTNCKFIVIINSKQENFVGNLQNNVLSSNLSKSVNLSFSVSSVFSHQTNHFYSSAPNSYSIVFKSTNDLNFPNKFLIDSGEVFKDFGNFAYGWNKPVKLVDHFFSSSSSIEYNTYGPFSGGINFPHASASEHCISEIECESNFWKFMTHENGSFVVQVLIGNTYVDDGQRAFVEVNGLPLIKNVELKKYEQYVAVKTIQVTNRSIILTSTCLESENDCAKAQTTLLAVQIVKTGSIE